MPEDFEVSIPAARRWPADPAVFSIGSLFHSIGLVWEPTGGAKFLANHPSLTVDVCLVETPKKSQKAAL